MHDELCFGVPEFSGEPRVDGLGRQLVRCEADIDDIPLMGLNLMTGGVFNLLDGKGVRPETRSRKEGDDDERSELENLHVLKLRNRGADEIADLRFDVNAPNTQRPRTTR